MGFLSRIFGKSDSLEIAVDFAMLKTDVHSHLIPGIDDGAQTIEESIELLTEFETLGYQKVITTPHIMSDYYNNTPSNILDGLYKLQIEIKQKGLKIEVEAAAEYNLDAGFQAHLDSGDLLCFGDKYILFELPFFNEPPMLNDTIWQLQSKGYKPVLAHVERYSYWHNNWDKIEEIKNRGVYIQLNINSLSGHYGPEVKSMAEKLVDKNLIDLLGTDCHNMNHMNLLKQTAYKKYLHKAMENKNLLNYRC